jgi:hypothetical protein
MIYFGCRPLVTQQGIDQWASEVGAPVAALVVVAIMVLEDMDIRVGGVATLTQITSRDTSVSGSTLNGNGKLANLRGKTEIYRRLQCCCCKCLISLFTDVVGNSRINVSFIDGRLV